MTLRIAALVKQIPAFEEMSLGPDGRLVRTGIDLEMNAYCRRAVAQAVEVANVHGGDVAFFTLGPPSANDVLREALAWAIDRDVTARGIHVSDPAFAGSDSLATSKVLAAVLEREGPFDLILCGRNSVDSDTGQVGPQVAELLDLPFATAARHLSLVLGDPGDPGDQGDAGDPAGPSLELRCEHDDGWVQLRLTLPGVVSCAERLIEPSKVPPERRASVPSDTIVTLRAADFGRGPWGAEASPTRVGRIRLHEAVRDRVLLDGDVAQAARDTARLLAERGALTRSNTPTNRSVPASRGVGNGPEVVVVVEPDRARLTSELLGTAAELAVAIDGHVVALGTHVEPTLRAHGADVVVAIDTGTMPVEEDVAHAISQWARTRPDLPWCVLAPSTAWGREVAARVAAGLGAGLTGDAVDLEVDDGRLVAWKPAFGGQLVAEILTSSPTQLATVRAGVFDLLEPRDVDDSPETVAVERIVGESRNRVRVLARTRDDDIDVLAEAEVVVGVGQAIPPDRYGALDPLVGLLGAELAATRKVTDMGWLPRARQLGITGRSIAPRLYVALGLGGKFNHMVGVRNAGTILAVNSDRGAPVFDVVDIGVVAAWDEFVPALVDALGELATSG